MKWHKFKKCLPPANTVVLVHVKDYEYMVGTIVAKSDSQLTGFAIRPFDDNGHCVEVRDCKAWRRFRNRSPWEGTL